MARVIVLVEGQTEEQFVNELLCHHLSLRGVYVTARLMGKARQRSDRGGIRGWPETRKEIINHLSSDDGIFVTHMVDYYALPSSPPNGWPGRGAAAALPHAQKAAAIHAALRSDLASHLDAGFDPSRYIPFVVMHEFEGLLFSDCQMFAESIGAPFLAEPFSEIRNQFETPEEINDSSATAPSKRVKLLYSRYQKTFLGPLAAMGIGLERMRDECPVFDDWLLQLEDLGN